MIKALHPDKSSVRINRQTVFKADGTMVSDNIVIAIECSTEDLADVVMNDIRQSVSRDGCLRIGNSVLGGFTDAAERG